MTRFIQFLILFTVVLFFSSLPSAVNSQASPNKQSFYVEGQVYCDTCRAQFINKLTEFMPGAEVKLQCRGEEEGNITYTVSGKTNDKGVYRLPVKGDHEDEFCQIKLISSTRKDCDEIPDEGWTKQASSITLTINNGMHGDVRSANPLGFLKKKALPECIELWKELDILPPDL
ncbi:major pollen allergen Lig v 1-like [Olea europaea var. sylvestris]|uniref:Major pollen allergen Ole e 1-like n=1 Tax=Olea europaea subsp. europaea TaxID=158383 RepID=A0A8S0UNN3_OLEEU|nr:major pollen allergen Lig v 1-like [Olea europaea var. sylvestris]CAA3019960.1 major pollen allergen Ole e 1-like [Olea europaea subsp. europaea]